jgi:hypothetical protein
MQRPQQQPPRPNWQQPSHQSMQQGPHSNAPTTHGAPTQGSRTGGACFKCGLTGHFAWQCPTRSTTPGVGNQVKLQGQQNLMHGKVNHMTSDEAQQAPDVVLGMFLAIAPCNYFIQFWSMQQGPHSNAPTTHGAPTQGSRTGGACFKCGLTGHFAWQCPTRSTTPGVGNQVKLQG